MRSIPRSVPAEQSPDAAEHRTFARCAAAHGWRIRDDAIAQPRKRKRLNPHAARTLQHRQKQSLTAEKHRLQTPSPLDVVLDRFFHRNQTARIHLEDFTVTQIAFDDRSACMKERQAIAFGLLQDESLTAKKPDSDFLLKRDANLGTKCRTQERTFFAQNVFVVLLKIERNDPARIRCRKSHFPAPPALVRKVRHEQRLAGQNTLADRAKLAEKSLLGLRAIAHLRFEDDPVLHVIHDTRFRDHRLIRIKCNFNDLNIVSQNFVLNLIAAHVWHS